MPAEIDGESFIAARQPGWHRIGVTKDGWFTAAQALTEADLDWDVEMYPVLTLVGGEYIEDGDRKCLVRKSPHTQKYEVLSVMGNGYRPVQNREAFQFADEIVGNVGGAHYETAGALRGGRQLFMTIATEAVDIILDPQGRADKIKTYILLINSHDGTLAFMVQMTNVRVVCANTLAMSLSEGKRTMSPRWSTKHTTNIMNRTEMAKRTLGIYSSYNEMWVAQAQAMIEKEMTEAKFHAILDEIFVDENKEKDVQAISDVRTLYELSPTNQNVFGTAWGGLQATTEYADWYVPVRGSSRSSVDEMRFRKQVGVDSNSTLKQEAWDRFYDLVNA